MLNSALLEDSKLGIVEESGKVWKTWEKLRKVEKVVKSQVNLEKGGKSWEKL